MLPKISQFQFCNSGQNDNRNCGIFKHKLVGSIRQHITEVWYIFFKYYDLQIQPSPVPIFFKSSVILKMLTCENFGD